MPLPTPTAGEERDAFLARCMADDTMTGEYPEQDQRAAVCSAQFEKKAEAGEPGGKKWAFPYPTKISDVNHQKRTLVWRISTDRPDRDHEVIQPRGVNLEHYQKNPVVLWAHNYDMPPIAKALWTKVSDDGHELISKPQFVAAGKYPWANADFASLVFEMYAEQVLSASSVGFIPLHGKGRQLTPDDVKGRPDWAGASWIYPEGPKADPYSVELLEYSAVPVPSNRDALQLAVKGMDAPSMAALGVEAVADAPFVLCGCGYHAKAPHPVICPECGERVAGVDKLPVQVARMGRVEVHAPVARLDTPAPKAQAPAERVTAPDPQPTAPPAEKLDAPAAEPVAVKAERLDAPTASPVTPPVERVALPDTAPKAPQADRLGVQKITLPVPAAELLPPVRIARHAKPAERMARPRVAKPTPPAVERLGNSETLRQEAARKVRDRRRGVVTFIEYTD